MNCLFSDHDNDRGLRISFIPENTSEELLLNLLIDEAYLKKSEVPNDDDEYAFTHINRNSRGKP